MSLTSLGADVVAMDSVSRHPDRPELHESAFAVLQNVMVGDDGNRRRLSGLAGLAFDSMERHDGEENLQTNACRLLAVVCRAEDDVQDERRRTILTMAAENFPDRCKELVDGLLQA